MEINQFDNSVIAEKAASLAFTGQYDLLENFVQDLDEKVAQLKENETFLRALIALKYEKMDFEGVYCLLRSGNFKTYDGLLEIWDEAHYREKEEHIGKPLTTLMRFRVRKRHPPPSNICPTGERPSNNFSDESRDILNDWLQNNIECPYPSKEETESLSTQTGLTLYQIKTWFANNRRRKGLSQRRMKDTNKAGNRVKNKKSADPTTQTNDQTLMKESVLGPYMYSSNSSNTLQMADSNQYLNCHNHWPTNEDSLRELTALCNRIREYTSTTSRFDNVIQSPILQRPMFNQYQHQFQYQHQVHPLPSRPDNYNLLGACHVQNSTPLHCFQPSQMYRLCDSDWRISPSSSQHHWSSAVRFPGLIESSHCVPQMTPVYNSVSEQANDMTLKTLDNGAATHPEVPDSEKEVALVLVNMKNYTANDQSSGTYTLLS